MLTVGGREVGQILIAEGLAQPYVCSGTEKKQKGQPIVAVKKSAPNTVYDLMGALRASIKGGKNALEAEKPKAAKAPKKAAKRKAG